MQELVYRYISLFLQTVTATVNPKPVITITNPEIACLPDLIDLTSTAVTAGSTTGLTFTYWTDVLLTVSYSTPASATNGLYYIKGTTPEGCSAISTIFAQSYPKPDVTSTNTSTICSSTSPNVILTASESSTYAWTVGTITGGITGASAGSGTTIDEPLSNPVNLTPGTVEYIVTPTSTTSACVGAPYTITVTVSPVSLPSSLSIVASQDTVFEGDNVAFEATAINGGPAPIYQWMVNGVRVPQSLTAPEKYFNDMLNNNDVVTCSLSSVESCITGSIVISNAITMTVKPHTFNLTLANDFQVSDRILEFDIFLLDTPPDFVFELDMLQMGIKVNPGIYNGGTITASIVSNSSELNSYQNPGILFFMSADNYIGVLARMFPGAGNGTIISTTAT